MTSYQFNDATMLSTVHTMLPSKKRSKSLWRHRPESWSWLHLPCLYWLVDFECLITIRNRAGHRNQNLSNGKPCSKQFVCPPAFCRKTVHGYALFRNAWLPLGVTHEVRLPRA